MASGVVQPPAARLTARRRSDVATPRSAAAQKRGPRARRVRCSEGVGAARQPRRRCSAPGTPRSQMNGVARRIDARIRACPAPAMTRTGRTPATCGPMRAGPWPRRGGECCLQPLVQARLLLLGVVRRAPASDRGPARTRSTPLRQLSRSWASCWSSACTRVSSCWAVARASSVACSQPSRCASAAGAAERCEPLVQDRPLLLCVSGTLAPAIAILLVLARTRTPGLTLLRHASALESTLASRRGP